MFFKSISFTLLSLGIACVPLLGQDDSQVTESATPSAPGVRWVEKEITIRTLVPVLQDDDSPEEIELPGCMPGKQIDPTAMQRRMLEWVRRSAGQNRPLRLVELADEGSVETKDVLLNEFAGQRTVLRHHSFTIGGLPYIDVSVVPQDCEQAVDETPVPQVKLPQVENHFPPSAQGAQQAYLRAMQQARQAQAMANAHASGAAPHGFGSGVGVSVTTGPDGQSKVVESYFGAAATKEGVSNRSYTLPAGSGHAVGVDATTDANGEVHIRRYGHPARQ